MMRYIKFLLLFFIITNNFPVFAQLYFNDNNNRLGSFSTSTCTYEYIKDESGSTMWSPIDEDIALHPDGRMFAIIKTPSLGSALAELDMKNKRVKDTLCIFPEGHISALVCSKDGVFYAGWHQLHSYNMNNGELTTYGYFSENRALGDLIFYNGALIGSLEGISLEQPIRLYEITPETLKIDSLLTFPPRVGFSGLTVYRDETCKQKKILGSMYLLSEERRYTQLQFANLETHSFEHICDVYLPNSQVLHGDVILGLTSTDEFRENCSLILDLDEDDSSGRLMDNFQMTTHCIAEFPICDTDVKIHISTLDIRIDSIVIKITQGVRQEGEELLSGQTTDKINIAGNNSAKLVLINNGEAQNSDFESVLRNIRFNLTSENPEDGEREISCFLYDAGSVSDPAKAFIAVDFSQPPSAGEDTSLEICENGARVNLFDELGGAPSVEGHWEPSLHNQDNFFYPNFDTSGYYSYIVQEGKCPADTSTVLVQVRPQPMIGLGEETSGIIDLCIGDTIIWDVTLPNAQAYFWSDGTNNPVNIITEPGIYFVEVRDDFGCNWFAQATIRQTEDGFNVKETSAIICEGEQYIFQNAYISQSGKYRDTIVIVDGCDSIFALTLTVHPTYQIQLDTALRAGTTVEIGGQLFSEAGEYNINLSTLNGCDSIINLVIVLDTTTEAHDLSIPAEYYVPTLLFPDKGEVFTVFSHNGQQGYIRQLSIFDRLGRRVYTTGNTKIGDTSKAWKGLEAAGMYFYEIFIEDAKHRMINFSGKVAVVR